MKVTCPKSLKLFLYTFLYYMYCTLKHVWLYTNWGRLAMFHQLRVYAIELDLIANGHCKKKRERPLLIST